MLCVIVFIATSMMNKYLIVFGLVCTSVLGWAQQIKFNETNYEFGRIKEIDGVVEHEYIFENTLDKPVLITQVKASCGCTTPAWSKDSIMPGQTGFVKAAFNPLNRPGYFNKLLNVQFSDSTLTTDLKFSGFVIARQQTIKEEFPDKIGNLGFNNTTKDLGPIAPGKVLESSLKVYNHSKVPITVSKFEVSNRLKMQVPVRIESEQEATLKFSFLAPVNGFYGPITEEFVIITDDAIQPKKTLKFTADIADIMPDSIKDFSKLANMQLAKNTIQFDTISTGKITMQELEIQNTGKQDLIIRKLMSNATYIKSDIDKKILKPGQKAKLKVSINTDGLLGKDAKLVTIYSNDPVEPIKKIPVRAIIVR